MPHREKMYRDRERHGLAILELVESSEGRKDPLGP